VQAVNCSNCGASVNLATGSECAHCGSPLSMLDMGQAQSLVETLRHAEAEKKVDPAWPMRAERAKHDVEMAFESFEKQSSWVHDLATAGLVGAGMSSLARWLRNK